MWDRLSSLSTRPDRAKMTDWKVGPTEKPSVAAGFSLRGAGNAGTSATFVNPRRLKPAAQVVVVLPETPPEQSVEKQRPLPMALV